MKQIKKILFAFVILFSVVMLSSCSGDDPTTLIVTNNPVGESLVYDFSESDSVSVRGEYSYWRITESGATTLYTSSSDDTTIHDTYTSEATTNGGEIRTYTYGATADDRSFDPSYQVYILPEVVVDSDEVVLVVFRYEDVSNVVYNIGETFKPEGIEAYAVEADGDIVALHDTLSDLAFEDLFTTDYVPLRDDEFAEEELFTVNFNYEGYTTSFDAYVASGESPISADAAGWFDYVLIIPVAFVMQFFAGLFGNSFAVGIILTTIIVRTLAWPIYAKSNDMTLRMSLAQPELQKLQAKYATRKDQQSQQMMQMETMQIYKKHKISALGCLMPFLQMPIFIAMYRVVRRITLEGGMYTDKVSNTMFLGIDLSLGGQGLLSASAILAVIVGASMFFLQRISQKKPSYAKKTATHNKAAQGANTEQTMKMVSYFMVIMMASFAYNSNALALYWVIGNIYSIGQTLVNRRLNERKHELLKEKELLG
ncbi:YidC/Oxa1 family membrane protein insertase [Mycoplasmatota bacterium]|nr:YidC/Oxa1 family membrane protein insertase [Mycoplasmatota bacterium]